MGERPLRFLVTCPARTGSTMLMRYLQSHPDVCAHGEVLAPDGPLNFYGVNYQLDPPLEGILMRLRDRDPMSFLHEFVWQAGNRAAVGFKGKYEELFLPRYKAVLDLIRSDTAIHVIYLTRENLLARYLSQYLAVKVHGVYNIVEGKALLETTVRLDPAECEEDFRRTEERQARMREWLISHPVLEVTYETVVRARTETLAAIQAFIGVKERELEARSRKINTRPLPDVIENWEELAAYFRGTPYERFFRN